MIALQQFTINFYGINISHSFEHLNIIAQLLKIQTNILPLSR